MNKNHLWQFFQPIFKEDIFKSRPLLLFWSAVLVMHAILPVHSDISVMAIISLVFGVYAAFKTGFFDVEPWKDLPKESLVGMGAFDFYVLIVVITSFMNPGTGGSATRVIIWVACVGAGFLLSRMVPRHDFDFYYPLFWVLGLSVVALFIMTLWGSSDSLWHSGRLKLFAIHPSRLALCAAPVFFWSVANLFKEGLKKNFLWLYGLALILSASIIFLSNTRSMILALPVALLVFLMVSSPRIRQGLSIILVFFVLAFGVLAFFNQDSVKGSRLVSAITHPTEDPTFKSRLPIWEAGWDAYLKAPWFGHGVKSYKALHKEYLAQHKEDLDERYGFYEKSVKQAHNLILGRMVETGTLGALAFLVFYLSAIYSACRYGGKNKWISAFLVFYLVAGMLDDGLFRVNDVIVLFAAGAALGFRLSYAKEEI